MTPIRKKAWPTHKTTLRQIRRRGALLHASPAGKEPEKCNILKTWIVNNGICSLWWYLVSYLVCYLGLDPNLGPNIHSDLCPQGSKVRSEQCPQSVIKWQAHGNIWASNLQISVHVVKTWGSYHTDAIAWIQLLWFVLSFWRGQILVCGMWY